MATKKQLIKKIQSLMTPQDDVGDLKKKDFEELERLAEYLEKVETLANTPETPVEEIKEDSELVWSKTEELEDVEEEVKEEKIDPKLMQEYIENKKPSELSVSEQRLYARTGILPVKKK